MIRPLSQFGPALLAFALTLAAGGCATQKAPPPSVERPVVATQPAPAATEAPADLSLPGSEPPPERRVDFYPGNDRLLDTAAFGRGKATRTGEGTIGLDFERASLREVVKVILGDVLKQNYVIEPGMEGMVTMHTSQPIGEDALIPTLETVLAANGAAMVRMREGVYRIGPRDKVKGSAPTTAMDRLPQGYSVRIVPLDYIGAVEMQNILKPIAPADGILRVDATRNLLVLAGTGPELANMLETVAAFDVDVLKGMSVGIISVLNLDVAKIAGEIERLTGVEGNPLAGLVRVVPLEHINSVMIITPRRHYLEEVRSWIERLDVATAAGGGTSSLFIYRVQNSDASHLAQVLSQLFDAKDSSTSVAASPLAPGLTPARVASSSAAGSGTQQTQTQANQPATGSTAATGAATTARTMTRSTQSDAGISASTVTIDGGSPVRVVADAKNNSLLVMASHADWQRIESALKRLDVAPLQVLVEASIIEVTLTGDLQYGLQWFFKSSFDGKSGQGILDLDDAAGLSAIVPGFSYTLTDSANLVRGVLNLLAKRSQLNVISSPSVLVLDNHMAQIQVGDQQPVEAGTTTTDGGTTTKSIQYKDTGVLMSVTPRVNAGGLITMEIAQEVTDVGSIDSATGQRAFLKRNITSTIAVQSGEMVVLGGLIRDNTSEGKTGIPVLHDLPVVGNLFGGTNKASNRTELIVLLTPRIVRDPAEAREVGRQLRSRMQAIDGELFPIPMPMAEEPAPPAGG